MSSHAYAPTLSAPPSLPRTPAPPFDAMRELSLSQAVLSSSFNAVHFPAANAIDGDPTSLCASTLEANAWLSVRVEDDLPRVAYVAVLNHNDPRYMAALSPYRSHALRSSNSGLAAAARLIPCSHQSSVRCLAWTEVWIGPSPGRDGRSRLCTPHSTERPPPTFGPFLTACHDSASVKGGDGRGDRYVTIRQIGPARYLMLAEVRVYALHSPPPTPPWLPSPPLPPPAPPVQPPPPLLPPTPPLCPPPLRPPAAPPPTRPPPPWPPLPPSSPPPGRPPPSFVGVILDTDMGAGLCTDVDDVATLCMLNALADNGEVTLLAVVLSTLSPRSVGVISVIQHCARTTPQPYTYPSPTHTARAAATRLTARARVPS